MPLVAYFSMEYGLHEEFPSYAGGLGVLAGDFMKSAGDLGMPVVGIGLRWAQGYTAQRIGEDGQPVDEWPEHKPDFLTDTGTRVRVRVAAREVECRVWRVARYQIAPLFLLEPTDPRDLWITRRLYDPRPDCRIAQEMLLGIGGVRALAGSASAGRPLPLQRGACGVRRARAHRRPHGGGASVRGGVGGGARRRIVFTTHTPVPAGNEAHALADLHRLGADCGLLRRRAARARRRSVQHDGGGPAPGRTGPTRWPQLHGETARKMWAGRGRRGAHHRHHQRRARGDLAGPARACRAVAATARSAPRGASSRKSSSRRSARRTGVRMDPDALTIGFARRAATYKRPDLLLREPERLARAAEGRARAGALRRQGASGGRRRQGGGREPGPHHPAVAGVHRLPRELRHGAGPARSRAAATCGSTIRGARSRPRARRA